MSVLRSVRWVLPALLVGLLGPCALGQKVAFSARLAPADVRAGEGAQVLVTATIPAGFHLYSLTQNANGGVATKIALADQSSLKQAGKPIGAAFKKVPLPVLNTTLEEYTGTTTFGLPVTVNASAKGNRTVVLKIQYQICNEHECMPPASATVSVTFSVKAGPARPARKTPPTQLSSATGPTPAAAGLFGTMILVGDPSGSPPASGSSAVREHSQSQGLLPFLFGAIAAGFASLLTPCVFPMIPITVSFFTKRKEGAATRGIRGAVAYCVGIVGAFTGLGLLFTVLFGATGIQNFAANPWVNMALGILFVVLAANLMGAFEIVLPGWLVNRAAGGSQTSGGLLAPLLMGLTFTLTSFTCTSPFIGTVLLAAAHGHYFYPFLGMLCFSSAFALPFFLLALFPQAMARMPRSGSWLVTVKAFMGFLELAAALKFFSSADLTWGTGLLTKPIFLAVWAGIAAVAGLYMIGWLRLPKDENTSIGHVRRAIGVLTLIGGVWCLASIEGRSLGDLDAFVPPVPYPYHSKIMTVSATMPGSPQNPLKSFDEAVKLAKQQNMPIFIDFTGFNCVNCRLMEKQTLPQADVQAELQHYVNVELFTDRPDAEYRANQDLEQKLAKTTALPVYVAVSSDGRTVIAQSEGFTRDAVEFVAFLRKGRATTSTSAL